jgi:hypothetical protein
MGQGPDTTRKERQMNWFDIFQGEGSAQYTINLCQVCRIDRSDEDSWEIALANGETYTLEDDDLYEFREMTKL